MPKFMATYDISSTKPDAHDTFREKAKDNGWSLCIKDSENKWWKLPNTTLIGIFSDSESAVASIKKAFSQTKAKHPACAFEKWLVADYGIGTFDSDEKCEDR